jgi:hypothetical protein
MIFDSGPNSFFLKMSKALQIMPKGGWITSKKKKITARNRKARETFYRTTSRPVGECERCHRRILMDQSPSSLCSKCLQSKDVSRAIENSPLFPDVLGACKSSGFVYSAPIPLWVYRTLLPTQYPDLWRRILATIFENKLN